MKTTNKSAVGQTLVESVVAIGVVVLIVTGLVVGVVSSLKSTESSQARSLATKLTQEGIETARSIRDTGWNSFTLYNGEWCLDNSATPSAEDASACENNVTAGPLHFTRKIAFSFDGSQMGVTVTTTWKESGGLTRTSSATTFFTQWR